MDCKRETSSNSRSISSWKKLKKEKKNKRFVARKVSSFIPTSFFQPHNYGH